jgi:Ca2+-binding EF-hand superfamily protein
MLILGKFWKRCVDKDQDGYITKEELMESLGIEDQQKAEKMIETADQDFDGRISYIEF